MEVYVIIYMFQLTIAIGNGGNNSYEISLIYKKNVYHKRYTYGLNCF